MCGIAGGFFVSPSAHDASVLRRMTDSLAHRGPDGEGLLLGEGFAFGHRRLAIVDLAGGAQPMRAATHNTVVCFNGEIYNHKALRAELEQRGYLFETASDTEVLVHGAHAWGAALPAKLNGMFAYAVWDPAHRRGRLARDRFGEKPLYYMQLPDGSLWFGSELRALMAHPGCTRRISQAALELYLTYEYVPWPHAAVEGVSKLEPGTTLVWEAGRVTIEPFCENDFCQPEQAELTDAEWVRQTRQGLLDSVRARTMADVPIGVFLSGGVDSSAIAALLAADMPRGALQTFSVAFDDPSFDESQYASAVASALGTTHHVRRFGASDLLDLVPAMMGHMDEPFGDASLLPTHLLSKFTREHVKVALGGDGGDELFLGYETFRADEVAAPYARLPRPLQRFTERLVRAMPVSTGNFSLDFVAKSFLRGAGSPGVERHVRWLSSFLPDAGPQPLARDRRRLLSAEEVFDIMGVHYDAPQGRDHRQRLSNAYIRTYLAEDILTKVDRASMAAGLEARSAFLDPELLKLVARMPSHLKMGRGLKAKWVLKQAVGPLLPAVVTARKKKGFGMPVAAWLKGPLRSQMHDLLSRDRLAAAGVFDPTVVERLMTEHEAGTFDHRKQLWTLMMFEAWRERWGVTVSAPDPEAMV